ncbi:MAG: hypothetical protein AB7F50_01190 [Fimbriimonadaceae bacterium]
MPEERVRLEKVGVSLAADPPRPTGPFASPLLYVGRKRPVNRAGPPGLGWRERVEKELALMGDLEPLLKRRAGHREISGLRVYETRAEYEADE